MKKRSNNDEKDVNWYKEKYGWFDGDFNGIKSKARVKAFAEVLTPFWMVEMMVDHCEPDVSEIGKTFFEPACGEGPFIASVLRRKLERATNDDERIKACQSCYGIDIQYDNVCIAREKLSQLAAKYGVDVWEARKIFARNVIHGDMLFFPMIARFYDWTNGTWTTLEDMTNESSN